MRPVLFSHETLSARQAARPNRSYRWSVSMACAPAVASSHEFRSLLAGMSQTALVGPLGRGDRPLPSVRGDLREPRTAPAEAVAHHATESSSVLSCLGVLRESFAGIGKESLANF